MTASIVIVDDDADVRMLLEDLLSGAGYVVQAARDGAHAFQLLENLETPDLILLDYVMPRMGGREFLALRRRDARLRAIPVILLSAWTREWSGTRLGIAEVLAKPVDPDKLLEVVARVIRSPVLPPMRRPRFERRRVPRLRLPETARRRMP